MSLERIEIRTSTKTTTVYRAPGYPIDPNARPELCWVNWEPCDFVAPVPFDLNGWLHQMYELYRDSNDRIATRDDNLGIALIDKQPIISFADSDGYYRDSQVRHRVWRRELLEKTNRSLNSAKRGV